jgi:flagellar hook-length control protein FliK
MVPQEVSAKNGVTGAKGNKKNKLGAFAKLLDGLMAKTGQAASTSKQTAIAKSASVSAQKDGLQVETPLAEQKKTKKGSVEKQSLAGAGVVSTSLINTPDKTTKADVKKTQQTGTVLAKNVAIDREPVVGTGTQESVVPVSAKTGTVALEVPVKASTAAAPKARKEPVQDASQTIALVRNFPQNETGKTVGTAQGVGEKAEDPRFSKTNKRSRLNVELYNERTGTAQEQASVPAIHSVSDAAGHTEMVDITVDLRRGFAQDTPVSAEKNSQNKGFADLLALELAGNLSNDIVQQASLVLRDDGKGIIRLSLKPETLGSVKIRLEMAENRVTGHIIVDSDEALAAFKKEVHSLEQAFKDSGFESAALNTSLSSNNGGTGRQFDDEKPFFSGRFVAGTYDGAATQRMVDFDLEPQVLVNMLA